MDSIFRIRYAVLFFIIVVVVVVQIETTITNVYPRDSMFSVFGVLTL